MRIGGRAISRGSASGEALLCGEPISFLGGVDAKTGVVMEKGSPIEGKSVAGKILVFPRGKGSTVGTYVLVQLKRNGVAPAGIINASSETIVAVGAILAGIPMVDMLERNPLEVLEDGMKVAVNGTEGFVEIG
ncbi:MAG: DUF126 domain-containing protein [Candidatus ainarchaeum sp.]|nr:DUF126 domain-containing protein [Candidatus ainarchaeum sp.]